MPGQIPSLLVLADGSTFVGESAGADVGATSGEVVFNTVLSGYQEVITDPSYAGQVITFTYPHLGNYGVNQHDNESRRPFCRGIVARDMPRRHSNHRAEQSLGDFLHEWNVPAISGVDTRRLTRVLRERGAMPGAFGTATSRELLEAAQAEPGTAGVNLVREVTTAQPYTVGNGPWRVVAYDYGIKRTILRHLGKLATVTVVPSHTRAEDVLAYEPQGVFLSNGPGDPEFCSAEVDEIRALLGRVPIFGICLGHQLLATALGGSTYKLAFGHHGGNHPVQDQRNGRIMITSQNHNFAVVDVANADVTHINLNDGVVEGITARDVAAFSVQHHPEAGPGPHESAVLFDDFSALMTKVHGAR